MKTLILILLLFATPARAFEIGQPIQINQYCMTVADFDAYMLRGQPVPIPEDIECFNTDGIRFMGTVVEVVKNFTSGGRSFSLFRIGKLAVFMGNGFLQQLSGEIFVPGLREGEDA